MQIAKSPTENRRESQRADKLYMENTLLRISGALFCHDPKRAPTCTQVIELNHGISEKNIVIRPDPKLGQPAAGMANSKRTSRSRG
jgi:hypothetical protein